MTDEFMADKPDDAIPIISFWRTEDDHGCFSNWYPAEFEYAGRLYTSVEQYMMFQKVSTFRKHDLAEAIMRTDDPSECKKIGRTKFPEYDSAVWGSVRKQVVKRGVRAKFRQNEDMLAELLSTEGALLAECSPNDSIWGIGIGIDDPAWRDVAKWKGRNLLGRILMEVRDELGREKLRKRYLTDASDVESSRTLHVRGVGQIPLTMREKLTAYAAFPFRSCFQANESQDVMATHPAAILAVTSGVFSSWFQSAK